MRLGARMVSRITRSEVCCCLAAASLLPLAHRSRLALTLAEREDISRGIASGSSIREIASRLDRAASTVSREVTRHGGRPAYRAYEAPPGAGLG